jgi:hypothetical protein
MRLALALPLAAATCLSAGDTSVATAGDGPSVAFTITDSRIKESSGLAASHLHHGIYWTHNDSGDGPYVYAVDSASGKTVATVTMRGIGTARDAEAISIGPDDRIYVGDIGDNLGGTWPKVWIYSFPEPKRLGNATVDAAQYTAQYDAGPRNAESLMVHPKTGRAYIASKNENGGALYEGPKTLSAHGVNVFRRIAGIPLWITDGTFSPDGTRLVLRGYFGALEYRWSGGAPHRIGHLDVPMQPQGESVAFTTDGQALMFGSEGSDSEVWRQPLSGSYLPDSLAAPSGSASQPGPASGAGPGIFPSHSATGRDLVIVTLAVAAVCALAVAGRRARRRR